MMKKDVLFADASRKGGGNALCFFQNNGSARFDHVGLALEKGKFSLSLSTCSSLASLSRRSFHDNAVPLARRQFRALCPRR